MKEDKTGRDFYPLTYALCGMSFLCAVYIQELQLLGRDTGAVPHLCVHSEKIQPITGLRERRERDGKGKIQFAVSFTFL